MNRYSDKAYWNERYRLDPQPFEWYQHYTVLRPSLVEVLKRYGQPRILVLGCGTSRLSEELYNEGFKYITNVDSSEVCIGLMREKYGDYEGMEFVEMDCGKLSFEDKSFDFILDKGTLDSVLCSMNGKEAGTAMISEVARVLKEKGCFFCVSHGNPEFRLPFLEFEGALWNVNVNHLNKPKPVQASKTEISRNEIQETQYHYVYVCEIIGSTD